ncbi:MAG TPA: hypothetical protein EYO60_06820 [Candidatus Lambdaproteobacteria bacterium]|nr:hypothetical protein [Candidatus Lambdaproteobacteria bacterium]
MFSNKTIVKLVSTGGLILFASLAAAQTYTSVPVKYEDGWWLEFKDDSRLSFKKNQGKLALQWKGTKHPWLSIKSQSVRADNFASLKTTTFDSYSKEKYAPILKSWQKRKAIHDDDEKSRYAKDKAAYEEELEDANNELEEYLVAWSKRKNEFFAEEMEKYNDEKKDFDLELANYKKEKEQGCDPDAVVLNKCPDKPESPNRASFNDPKPKLKKPPVPAKPRSFKEKPKPNKDPAYQVTALALRLSVTGCPSGNFRLETSPGKIHFVSSRAEDIKGASPWSESAGLIRCSVSSKTGRVLMKLDIDQKRLVALSLDAPKGDLRLKRVSSPALRKFEKEFAKRDMYLKKLDFRKERVEASYWNAAARTTIDIVFEMSGKKKNIQKVSTTLPVYLYDTLEKNLDRLVTRVNLFQVRKLGDKKMLQLRRLYKHKAKGDPKKWMTLAKITHVNVKGNINNLIKLQTRTGASVEKLDIGSGGFVTDFSALLYLAAWHTKQKTQSLPLTYFDDTRVFVMELNRLKKTSHHFQGRQLATLDWEVKNSDGGSFMRLLVGLQDQIVYKIEIPERKQIFDLRSIGTQRIRKNQAWAEQFQKKHQLVPVSGF